MELKTGYKQTEIGIIPENWEVKKLGELTSLRTGPFGSSLHKSDYITDGIPFINPTHIFDGDLFPDRNITVSKEAVMRLSEFQLRTNDIILGRRGEMGRCAVVKEIQQGWLCGSGSLIMRPNGKIVPELLRRIISSPQIIAKIEETSVGSTMINLNQAVLFGLRIQVPPFPEQYAIAAALSDVDALLNSLDALIAKKRLIKQGTMQELLTGKKRLPGFSGEWEEKTLDEFVNIFKGNGLSKSQIVENGNRKCVLYGELFTTYKRVITDVVSCTNSDEGVLSVKGDILMPGSTTTTGIDLATASALLVENVALGGDVIIIRANKTLVYTPEFLANYMSYVSRYSIAEITQGTTIHHLYGKDLKKLRVKLPKFEEQTAIAKILSDMDAEISALEQKHEKTRLLKQGMMQELLTGRIRLV